MFNNMPFGDGLRNLKLLEWKNIISINFKDKWLNTLLKQMPCWNREIRFLRPKIHVTNHISDSLPIERCQWENEPASNKDTDVLPTSLPFLENSLFEGCFSICTLLDMVMLHYRYNQVSMVVADVLVPIWSQVICNNFMMTLASQCRSTTT